MSLLPDRDHEGSVTSDDAVAVVLVQVLHVPPVRWALEQQGQAVDCDALRDRLVTGLRHRAALIVSTVAGDVDDLPHGLSLPLGEQTNAEVDGP